MPDGKKLLLPYITFEAKALPGSWVGAGEGLTSLGLVRGAGAW